MECCLLAATNRFLRHNTCICDGFFAHHVGAGPHSAVLAILIAGVLIAFSLRVWRRSRVKLNASNGEGRKGGAGFQPPTQNQRAQRPAFRVRAGRMFALRGGLGGRLEARPSFTRYLRASSCRNRTSRNGFWFQRNAAASCWKKRTDFSRSPAIIREPTAFFTPKPPASAGAETRQASQTSVRGWPWIVMGSIS